MPRVKQENSTQVPPSPVTPPETASASASASTSPVPPSTSPTSEAVVTTPVVTVKHKKSGKVFNVSRQYYEANKGKLDIV